MRGDLRAGLREQMEAMRTNPEERQQFLNAMRGHTHTRFLDRTGVALSADDVNNLYILTMGGSTWCEACNINFPNYVRLVEHLL